MLYRKQVIAALVASVATASAMANSNETARQHLPVSYCLYDLGRLPELPAGETSISVTAINNRNQAVGWMTPAGGAIPLSGFIWDRKNGIRDLGDVPGLPNITPVDINDAGAVVGDARNMDVPEGRAFLWRNGEMEVLDVSLGGSHTYAYGINRSGQIVGASEINPEFALTHAYLREPDGDVLDLGAFPDGDGFSTATAVNNRGWVVGYSEGSYSSEAFIWNERHGMRRLLENATTVTLPLDINDRGEVVGDKIAEQTRAFRWTRKAGLQDLGTLSGGDADYATATSINRWGHIVGGSQIESGDVQAFVWSRRTGMLNLNQRIHPTSALANVAVILIAQSINDAGWIVADGYLPGAPDPRRSFVLIPRHRPTTAACESQ
jgi:probable HAF family extracellular repeat protein